MDYGKLMNCFEIKKMIGDLIIYRTIILLNIPNVKYN